MKPALVVLLCISGGFSPSYAQNTPTPVASRSVRAPEIDLAAAGSALIILAGVVAIARGKRKG
jgi:hypothetical protein